MKEFILLAIVTGVMVTGATGQSNRRPSEGVWRTGAGPQPDSTFSNTIVTRSLNNIQFAEQFSGADASAKIQAAIAALPPNGGVVDARNLHDIISCGGSTHIDPGTKTVQLWLGPYNYYVSQISLRNGFSIIGYGSPGGVPNSPGAGTTLTSCSTSSEVFTLGPYNGHSATNVFLSNFGIFGPGNTTGCTGQRPSATTDAFTMDANLGPVSALQYSTLKDIWICGFSGVGLHFVGNKGSGGTHQFNNFDHVVVARAAGGASALKIEGSAYQFIFNNPEFDANCYNTCIDAGSTSPNIYLGGVTGGSTSSYPYIFTFNGLTSQGAVKAVQIDGASNVSFVNSHHEENCVAYDITYGASGVNIPTDNITVDAASFNGNVGKGSQTTTGDSTCATKATHAAVLKTETAYARGVTLVNSVYLDSGGGAGPDNVVYATAGSEINMVNNEVNTVGTWAGVEQRGMLRTVGMTPVIASATMINTGNVHFVILTGTKAIKTINSTLGPGEAITFSVSSSPGASFTDGGNLALAGHRSVYLNTGDTATFVANDALIGHWQLVHYSCGSDGGMCKQKRASTCSTTTVQFNSCANLLAWTTPFPDADYSVSCTLTNPDAPGITGYLIDSKTPSSPHVTTINLASGSAITSGTVECIAVHD